jgi:hypothetical protein
VNCRKLSEHQKCGLDAVLVIDGLSRGREKERMKSKAAREVLAPMANADAGFAIIFDTSCSMGKAVARLRLYPNGFRKV